MGATKIIERKLKSIKKKTAKQFALRPLVSCILVCAVAFFGFWILPGLTMKAMGLQSPTLPSSSGGAKIYDRTDHLVATIYGERDSQPVPLKEMSPNITHAIIAAEDHDFYTHDGIDVLAICRAILIDVTSGHAVQGGSTISQQLVKNLYFEGKRRTLVDKIKEAVMAIDMERRYSKDQILEAYLNYVYFGDGVYGIDRAAEHYFGKPSGRLSIAEACYLAALVNAPSELCRLENRKEAIARQQFILSSMQQLGYATPAEIERAKKSKLVFRARTNASRKYLYYTSQALQQTEKDLGLEDNQIYSRGLSIYTNLDPAAQIQAEEALTNGIRKAPKGVNQGALVSISVPDGAIIAMVGGAGKFENNQWNRAMSPHTAGSAFKPFVYLAALSKGVLAPDSLVNDEPLEIKQPGCPTYRPRNFDGQYLGQITIRKALALSRNTCAVRVAQAVGPGEVANVAHLAGINSKLDENLALALGSSAVTPLEMANAYATLARGGESLEPQMIRRICDNHGQVLKSYEHHRQRVFAAEPVSELVDALEDVVEKGTGTRARLFDRPVAGKTGTSDQARDIWFVGFTPDLVTAVWGGNEDNKPVPGHVTGGTIMAGIWQSYTRTYYQQHSVPAVDFAQPLHPLLEEAEPIHILPAPANIFDRLLSPFEGHEPEVREYKWRSADPENEASADRAGIERHREPPPDEPSAPHRKRKGIFKRFLNWLDF